MVSNLIQKLDYLRVKREKHTIEVMVKMYCHDIHKTPKGQLCDSCKTTLDYAILRIDKCVFGTSKPACTHCPVHCFRKDYKEKMRQIMRYAGPRMTFRHPFLAFMHLFDKIRGIQLSKKYKKKK